MNRQYYEKQTIKYVKDHLLRYRIALIIFTVLLILYLILTFVSSFIVNRLDDQHLAERWSDDMRSAQVSVFITEDQKVTEEDIKRFNHMLKKKLVEAGVTGEEENEVNTDNEASPQIIDTIGIDEMNKSEIKEQEKKEDPIERSYTISYCAQGTVSINLENRQIEKVAALGVGGDFFLFHPMTFLSGGFFSGDDLMKDSIVIDEDLAWQLYGSTDIIGQGVMIGNVPHYIVGVVAKEHGRITEASGLSKSYVYMSYDSLSKYGDIFSGSTESGKALEDGSVVKKGGINCIEVVCPNPVKGLAARIAKESLAIPEENVKVIDNTDRFSFFSLYGVLISFGLRSMNSMAIYYPYWENAARGYEDILALILLFRLICIIIAIIIFTFIIVDSYRNKKWKAKDILNYISEKKYDLEVAHEHKRKEKRDRAAI